MARMKSEIGTRATIDEGEATLVDTDFDDADAMGVAMEAGLEGAEEGPSEDDDGDGPGDAAGAIAEVAEARGKSRAIPGAKPAAGFEVLGLRVKRGAAGRCTISVEIELGSQEARPKAPPAGEPEAAEEPEAEEDAAGMVKALSAAAGRPVRAAGRLRLSKKGAQLIARFEGLRLRLYNDPAGHCTIGVGHLVHRGRCNGREPAELKRGITRARAFQLLQKDASTAEKAVRRLRVPLNQRQFDALVSFTFNVGAAWTTKSKLRDALLARRYKDVPSAMSRWVYAGGKRLPGLVRRRRAEGKLFRAGKYT